MLNFINNGGLEMILAGMYMAWVIIQYHIEDRRTRRRTTTQKWNWN